MTQLNTWPGLVLAGLLVACTPTPVTQSPAPTSVGGVAYEPYLGPSVELVRWNKGAAPVGFGILGSDGLLQGVSGGGRLEADGRFSAVLPTPAQIAPFIRDNVARVVLPGLDALPCTVRIDSTDLSARGVNVWPYAELPGAGSFKSALFGYHRYSFKPDSSLDYQRAVLVYADRATILSAQGTCETVQYQIDAPLQAGWNTLSLTVGRPPAAGNTAPVTSLRLTSGSILPETWALDGGLIMPW
jgi:hypothetical protein